jgi:hypothetical protein
LGSGALGAVLFKVVGDSAATVEEVDICTLTSKGLVSEFEFGFNGFLVFERGLSIPQVAPSCGMGEQGESSSRGGYRGGHGDEHGG